MPSQTNEQALEACIERRLTDTCLEDLKTEHGIFEDIMAQQRKIELDLYRLISSDNSSKIALIDTMKRMVQPRIGI